MPHKSIAVIVDIVDSRRILDRSRAQSAVHEAFESHGSATERPRLYATVGDEFQIVYPSLSDALVSTLLARLALPDGVDIRVGLGEGEVREVSARADGVPIQDGSAWWAAREAIEEAHRREDRASPYLRSWFVDAASTDAAGDTDAPGASDTPNGSVDADDRARLVNTNLLLRDQLVSRMPARARRLTAGVLAGVGQEELARLEGVSQSAVSQTLHRYGGAALLASMQLFRGSLRA